MSLLHDVPIGKNAPGEIQAVVEIPRDSKIKYEIDPETGLLHLDRILYCAFVYPANYGFIPQSWGEDNDPLDVLVVSESALVPGCILKVRPIGIMRMEDEHGKDDKVIGVAIDDSRVNHYKDIKELSKNYLDEIAHFFERYKDLEKGKHSKFIAWEGKDQAVKAVQDSMDRYKKKFKK